MKLTPYFEKIVLNKRLEINLDWCNRVIANPLKVETQPDGRIRHWGIIAEADNRVLRVVTLDDGETIHNAFFDLNFRKQLEREGRQIWKSITLQIQIHSFIELSDRPSVRTEEINELVTVDFDTAEKLVGITIESARNQVDLNSINILTNLELKTLQPA